MTVDLQTASFCGTLAYGRLVLAMLFVANLFAWGMFGGIAAKAGVALAIAATAAAYFSQMLHTADNVRLGLTVQLGSTLAAVASGIALLAAG